jgi:F420-dependent oxidoreductase-like protein
MPTGVVIFPSPQAANAVDDVVAQAKRAYASGVEQIWLGQLFDVDSIALAAVIGTAVPGLGVGTNAVPINPRHPLIVASLAQTAQAAAHGNFSLGVALGGHEFERKAFGISPANTVQRLREHLTVLRSVLEDGAVSFQGNEITAAPELPVQVAGGTPIPLYVAAMGPKALQVTGELADGTQLFLAGPRTIAEFIEPTLSKAAADAGRPKPRIIASVPVLVSDDVDAARAEAVEQLAFYEAVPSYQKVLAREGVKRAGDLAIIGTPDAVAGQLASYRDAGATDLVLSPVRRDDAAALQDIWDIAGNVDAT